jgi:integrase
MATIKYLLQSKSDSSPIYLRLSINRKTSLKRKTGLIINSKDWSESTSLPKQTEAKNKSRISTLRKLEYKILDKLNDDFSRGVSIDGNWLSYNIDLHFERISDANISEHVLDVIKEIADNADTRINSKGGIGLSKSRIQAYNRLSELFNQFQGRKNLKIKELNKTVFNSFKKWLKKDKKYSDTYTFKKISDLKTVCKISREFGVTTSDDIDIIKTPQAKAYEEDMDVITLTFEDLEKIEKAKLISDKHINARKWLILGCYTGQRGKDLINKIVEKNFQMYGKNRVIKITQKKGNKHVIIPVLPKVEEIYLKGLPKYESLQKLNLYYKEIGIIAELNEMVLGRLQDPETKRGVKKIRPKHKYISTHIGRRSFASNYYGKIPTPLLMRVTQHAKESTFLTYINQSDDSHVDAFLEYFNKSEITDSNNDNIQSS